MKLKIGDVVKFKKYEDLNDDDTACIAGKFFPKLGKIKEIRSDGSFFIEHSGYIFNPESVARVIIDVDSLNVGDVVLAKVTIGEIRENHILTSWIDKSDVVEILKRKEPERFIVQENHYGMYIGSALGLVSDKSKAQVYASTDAAYQEANDMHLISYDVIPYDA